MRAPQPFTLRSSPNDYYRRFGFRNTPGFGVEGVPAEVFFGLPFAGHIPQGQVTFHEAFGTGH